MKCPICNKHELVAQSLEDSFGNPPDLFCPEIVTMTGGKILNHYREYRQYNHVRMITPPYRIITQGAYSKVAILSRYKTGDKRYFFKTILKLPAIHPDSQEKLLERIKLLLLLS